MNTSFYTPDELAAIGFKSVGTGVLLSRKASIYGASGISIGDNVRIDDFCVLSGNLTIGSNIHIAAYVALYGALGIVLEDYTGISARTTIYSAMDDFSGDYLIGPIHPEGTTNVTGGCVTLKNFSTIGAHCLVFPKVTVGEGSVVGAMSLVAKSLEPWGVYLGSPCQRIRERSRRMLELL